MRLVRRIATVAVGIALVAGHTHQAYADDAPIPGQAGKTRPIIQTGSYGTNVGQIEPTVDPETGEVRAYSTNLVATLSATETTAQLIAGFPRVAAVNDINVAARTFADQIGNQVVGHQVGDLTTAYIGSNRDDRASESTLSGFLADAYLAQVSKTPAGADLALTNPGGCRPRPWSTSPRRDPRRPRPTRRS